MLRAPSPGLERADTKSGWASTFPSTAKNARFPNVELLTDATVRIVFAQVLPVRALSLW
jgi:hypothetical protein